jgi:hypothetical protein
MPEDRPETHTPEMTPQEAQQGQPAEKRKSDAASPEEIRQFQMQSNKNPDDFDDEEDR